MAGEAVETNSPGGAAPSPATMEPADYAELRAFREQATQSFAALEPYADDLKWMAENEDNVKFIRQARETYENSRRSQEPQLDANGQLLWERFKPAVEYVSKLQEREQQMTAQQQAEHNRKVRSEADALITKDPRLANNNRALLQSVANYGDQRGISSLTEAYNEWSKDIGVPEARAATPPRSLRGEAGAAGVPGPSTLPPIKSPKDIRARLRTAFANPGR